MAPSSKLFTATYRSLCRLEQTEKDIKAETPTANIRLLVLDLGSFATVRVAADEVNSYPEPLDVLPFDTFTFSPGVLTARISITDPHQ